MQRGQEEAEAWGRADGRVVGEVSAPGEPQFG